ALYAFSRLTSLNPTVQTRLLEVAKQAIERTGIGKSLAIRALGSAGQGAVEPLKQVLSDAAQTPGDRASASRALARLGNAGQTALQETLSDLLPATDSNQQLLEPAFGTLWATLLAIQPPV